MEAKRGIYDIAEICRFHGVETAVLCPGSRCAPLTLAFSRTEGIRCMSIVDERSAAFMALGIAETTDRPVVLVCTSGSAVLNFGPALAEAFYRHIPLLVLTADRPQRLVGQHDGQTMNQPDVFANFVQESFSLAGDVHSDTELDFVHRTINAALIRAKSAKGPVHVNISFEEPLYQLADSTNGARYISWTNEPSSVKEFLKTLPSPAKWLCVAGSRKPSAAENELLAALAQKVPVLAESISNFGRGAVCNANEMMRFVAMDDKPLFVPDVLVTFGEGIISKNVKSFIRTHEPQRHIHISPYGEIIDTYQCLTDVWAFGLKEACTELLAHLGDVDASYRELWHSTSQTVAEKVKHAIADVGFGDLKAIDFVTSRLPASVLLHVANSMPVRYVNICAHHLSDTEVYCNRGTSGIDGSISTAIGNAIGSGKQVWVITGDLSFQYDGNALWNAYLPKNVRIVIINNAGGGIFRLIDGPSSVPELVERFETRTQTSAGHKAAQYGLEYFSCHQEKDLEEIWESFLQDTGSSKILEIFTEPLANEQIFKSFQQQLSNKI